jgi:hypothetical protein
MAEYEEITRRDFLTGLGAAAVLVPVALREPVGTLLEAPRRSEGVPRSVRLRQGTELAAQVSPDGRTIAMDLVGVLWVLPAAGTAKRLTSDLFDIAQPDRSAGGVGSVHAPAALVRRTRIARTHGVVLLPAAGAG